MVASKRALLSTLLGGCTLALSACRSTPEHSFAIDLRTDFHPALEFDTARVEIDGAPNGGRAIAAAENTVAGVRILERTLPQGEHRITVRLTRDVNVVAERSYQVRIEDSLSLVAVISRSCAGVTCYEGQSCIDGRCGSTQCLTGTEASCVGACVSDDDCPPTMCSGARCASGVCLASVDTSTCAPNEYCVPDQGCRLRPGELPDAGLPDTGPPDTGPPDAGQDVPPPPDPPTDDHLGDPPWVPVAVELRDGCSPITACGGNAEGIWDVSGGCLELVASAADVMGCSVSYDLTGMARGRLRIGATRMDHWVEWSITGSIRASCGVPCNLIEGPLESALSAELATVSCDGCDCTGADSGTEMDNGAYTLGADALTIGGRTYEYCEAGFDFQRTSEPSTFVLASRPLM